MAYGFTRCRPPDESSGSTRYECTVTQATVTLWGFGIMFRRAEIGSVFLDRHSFQPVYACEASLSADVFRRGDLGGNFRPCTDTWARCRLLLVEELLWIADYERWVLKTIGKEYRSACLEEWPLAVTGAEELPQRWHQLASEIEGLSSWDDTPPPALPPAFSKRPAGFSPSARTSTNY